MRRPRLSGSATPPPGQAFSAGDESRVTGPQTRVYRLSWHRSGARQLQKGLVPDTVVSLAVSVPPPPPRNLRGTELVL
ncbi:hypothetical protein NDU88_007131 [Pleurodeles waltl]|uniref:Uncharacterized protein n=1 Tax=Pleurodeles waltl TaxID=8319 RepID=A0AAV7VNU4_PLEWA|nr:hypothetical protein NDU88_007128 [Pleurodeles waltl]KAJ1203343.1 hypothetical protein NDU88_007130 [Pleurodeles waltl]KAJ1203344.1 hypothetical protein NDU88_007131 [Pleurodeles waltl]